MTFAEEVYRLCQQVPPGKVTTYKEIAHVLGSKRYRAVGQALRCNPYAPKVPCHRVVASDGSIGGFKGTKQGKPIQEKVKLLEMEGVKVINGKINLSIYSYQYYSNSTSL